MASLSSDSDPTPNSNVEAPASHITSSPEPITSPGAFLPQPSEGTIGNAVTLPAEAYAKLIQLDNAEPTAKIPNYKAPPYCVKKLTKDATQVEIADWCEGITDGNSTVPEHTPEQLKILWFYLQMKEKYGP